MGSQEKDLEGKLRVGAENSLTASAAAMDGASSTSQSYGSGFLEACLEFCQAESIPGLQLQPDSSLGFGHPASNPAEKGQVYPAVYVRLGWKPHPGVNSSTFFFSLHLPIPVESRTLNRAAHST